MRISLLRECSRSDDDSKALPSSWEALGAVDQHNIAMFLLLCYKMSLGWTCIGKTRWQGSVIYQHPPEVLLFFFSVAEIVQKLLLTHEPIRWLSPCNKCLGLQKFHRKSFAPSLMSSVNGRVNSCLTTVLPPFTPQAVNAMFKNSSKISISCMYNLLSKAILYAMSVLSADL